MHTFTYMVCIYIYTFRYSRIPSPTSTTSASHPGSCLLTGVLHAECWWSTSAWPGMDVKSCGDHG